MLPATLPDDGLLSRVGKICDEFECYGYRRVGAALRHQGVVVNGKKLRRLMREHDLQPKQRRRYVVTTDSDHAGGTVTRLGVRRPIGYFRVCSLAEGGCVAWMLRLVKIGVEGEGPCTDILEIRRPDDLIDIANLGLTLSEAKRLLAGV